MLMKKNKSNLNIKYQHKHNEIRESWSKISAPVHNLLHITREIKENLFKEQ